MKDETTNALPSDDSGGSSRPRSMSEGWLWCHALGLLNPEEEEAVRKTVAADEECLATLTEIRQALGFITSEDRVSTASVSDRLQQAVTDALQQFGAMLRSTGSGGHPEGGF